MRTHYTHPGTAFYRCEEAASRRWWAAHRNLETVHRQAVTAFTDRHRDLLGQDGYLWDSILWGPTIVASARPAGCRPHTHQVDPPQGGQAWLPDGRTRTGRMLAAQIEGLPRFDSQAIAAAAPLPGGMPWIHPAQEGPAGHFRVLVDGVLYLSWPQPVPGLDTAVWTPIDREEFLAARDEADHRERVRGLEVIHARLTRESTIHPQLLWELAAAVARVLAQHRADHAQVAATRDAVLAAEHLLAEHHHLSDPDEQQVRAHIDAVLHTLAA